MSKDFVGQASEPPPYEEGAHLTESSLINQGICQLQPHSGYIPVQYNLAGQDPMEFYGALINASSHPSEIFCRMADALFFYMDQNCNRFRGTQRIEPAKIAWLGVALGQETELSMTVEKHLPSLYDAASIPYTFNDTETPVLDRRGHLHLCVFEGCADPGYARQKWNKALNILQLHDPLTNLPFPTPIPFSAFPVVSNFLSNQVYTNWQIKAALHMSHQTSNSLAIQYGGESAGDILHTSSTMPAQQAVPIARRAAFQTMKQYGKSKKLQEKNMQLETVQKPQGRISELGRIAGGVTVERSGGKHNSTMAQVPQTVSIARHVAFRTVQQERPHIPAASSSMVLETPQDTHESDDKTALSQALGASREYVDIKRNNGLHKQPTTRVQQAVSIARRAAFQTVQQVERVQKIQTPKSV